MTQQMEGGIPKIEFTGVDVDAELEKFADRPFEAAPARIKEMRFLQENAGKYGYVQEGNSFVKVR